MSYYEAAYADEYFIIKENPKHRPELRCCTISVIELFKLPSTSQIIKFGKRVFEICQKKKKNLNMLLFFFRTYRKHFFHLYNSARIVCRGRATLKYYASITFAARVLADRHRLVRRRIFITVTVGGGLRPKLSARLTYSYTRVNTICGICVIDQ